METLKACVHCRHLGQVKARPICLRPEALGALDLVYGARLPRDARELRAPKGACGPSGKLWEAMPRPFMDRAAALRMSARAMGNGLVLWPAEIAHGIGNRVDAFRQRIERTREAWRGPRPLALAAPDPIGEAQAIQDGGPAQVNPAFAEMLAPDKDGSRSLVPVVVGALVLAMGVWAAALVEQHGAGDCSQCRRGDPAKCVPCRVPRAMLHSASLPCCWDVPVGTPCVKCRTGEACGRLWV